MRFANDAYRRFIQMFGKIVMDVPADAFEHALDEAKERKGPGTQDTDLDVDDLADADRAVPAIYQEHTGRGVPAGSQGPAAPGDRRGLLVVERQARDRLPAPEQDLATTWAPR